jgi:hypothetical protein
MEKRIIIFILMLQFSIAAIGQKYFTRSGSIRFFSSTPIENIEAVNNQATCIIDIETGEVVSKVLMKSFRFKKALMQEHFNENYVESDRYPQAVLNAKIANLDQINPAQSLVQQVFLNANLTIRGVTKNIDVPGTIQFKDGILVATAIFIVKPSDFGIKIPKAVAKNIAKEIEISVEFNLDLYNK